MVKAKKIKENRWRASIYLGKNEYGKKIYKDIYGTSEKECNSKVVEFLYKKENNLLDTNTIEKTNLKTIEEFYDEWLENRIDLKEGTLKEYRSIKKCHLTPLLKLNLNNLSNSIVKKFYKDLYEKTNAKTTIKVSRLFNCFLHSMLDDPRNKLDPFLLKGIVLPKASKYIPHHINNEEYKNIIDALKQEYENNTNISYLYILTLLCSTCGLRISEALSIKINDINFENSTIPIYKEQTQKVGKGYFISESTKTESGTRIIVMPKAIKEIILSYITKRRLELIKLQQLNITLDNEYLYLDRNKKEFLLPGNELLISSSKYKMIPKNTAEQHWKKFRESLGYTEQIRIHDFRRFTATTLRDNNIPQEIARLQLGHSDAAMTRYYQNTDVNTLIDYIGNLKIDI